MEDKEMTLDELMSLRTELVEEKTRNTSRIIELRDALKIRQPRNVYLGMSQERDDLVIKNAQLEADLSGINVEIKALHRSGATKLAASPKSDLALIIRLITSRRQMGQPLVNIEQEVEIAVHELNEIRKALGGISKI